MTSFYADYRYIFWMTDLKKEKNENKLLIPQVLNLFLDVRGLITQS